MDVSQQLQAMIDQDGRLKVEVASADRTAKFGFVYHQHTYLNNAARFADLKSGALAGVNGTLLGLMFRQLSLTYYPSMLLFFVGAATLFVSLAMALWVVYPRRERRRQKGLLYWEGVCAYDEVEYAMEMMQISRQQLLERLLRHNHVLSGILSRKYRMLNRAFKVSMLGYALLGVAFMLNAWVNG